MAAKKISFKVSSPIEVGNVDVEFEVRDGAALMGTVAISRGGIDWRGKGKRRATPVSWARFADLMSGADARVGPPTPTKARRAVKQPAPIAAQKAIRSWAQEKGMRVKLTREVDCRNHLLTPITPLTLNLLRGFAIPFGPYLY